jgi:hypothetical protein
MNLIRDVLINKAANYICFISDSDFVSGKCELNQGVCFENKIVINTADNYKSLISDSDFVSGKEM